MREGGGANPHGHKDWQFLFSVPISSQPHNWRPSPAAGCELSVEEDSAQEGPEEAVNDGLGETLSLPGHIHTESLTRLTQQV